MKDDKLTRIAKAKQESTERRQKAIRSLSLCLSRSDVMRIHHDVLVKELADSGLEFTDVKKARFAAYVCFWFATLAAVIERYEQVVSNGTIPRSDRLSSLLTKDFIDLLKPFRNAVAHCSDHDDQRVLNLLDHQHTIPDHAEQIAHAFQAYFKEHTDQQA